MKYLLSLLRASDRMYWGRSSTDAWEKINQKNSTGLDDNSFPLENHTSWSDLFTGYGGHSEYFHSPCLWWSACSCNTTSPSGQPSPLLCNNQTTDYWVTVSWTRFPLLFDNMSFNPNMFLTMVFGGASEPRQRFLPQIMFVFSLSPSLHLPFSWHFFYSVMILTWGELT